MATKSVTGKITGPDGSAKAGALVVATLSQPAVITGTQEVVPSRVTAITAADGTFSLTLQANGDLTPAGTFFNVTEAAPDGGFYSYTIVVPQGAGPYVISNIQTNPPTASPTPFNLAISTQAIAYAATVTPDASKGERITITLTGNITIAAPTNAATGQFLSFQFIQDATGSRTVTWNSVFKTAWQAAPTANAISQITFVYDGTNWQQFSGEVPVDQNANAGFPGNMVAKSFTVVANGPYVPSAPAGSVGGLYFAPAPIGGGTDDTAAINAVILAVSNAGGGTIVFQPKGYRINGALVIPNNGGSPPTQPSLRLMGSGATWNGFWGVPTAGATVFDMRFNGDGGTHVAKIDTRGAGLLELDHIVFTTTGDDFPFVQTTNTTIKGHHNAFLGNRNKTGTACVQDCWILGGTGASSQDLGSNSMFQGYGTHIHDNFYDQIRHVAVFGAQANAVITEDETVSSSCGSATTIDGPFFFSGSGAGGGAGNVQIRGGTIELVHYNYAIVTDHTTNSFFTLGTFDGTPTAAVYTDINSSGNLIFAISPNTHPPLTGPGAANQTILSTIARSQLQQGLQSGLSLRGSVSGGYADELSLDSTGVGGNVGISTARTGGPTMYFDHRGAANTGVFVWRNNGAATTLMSLANGGHLALGGQIQPGAGWGIDAAASGSLPIGGVTATSVIVGRSGQSIGFYGHAAVTQPAAPVTLADVIAIIRGCGLSA